VGVVKISYKVSLLLLIVFLAGCTHVPRDGNFDEVERLVNERIPQKVHWYKGGDEDIQVKAALNQLLEEPLTSESVVQIALLNNRQLQSEYEELGIAQADLVQAGLLSNPVLFASIRFPKGGAGGNNTEFGITKEFLDLLLRPARKRIAATEFERAKLRVSNAVIELAASVQRSFYQLQGKQQLADIQNVAASSAQTSYELAQRFDEAGNLSELELAQERSAAAEMKLELLRTQADVQSSRDNLNALLALTGTDRQWSIEKGLSELPETDPDLESMEEKAIKQRLDLKAANKEIDQLSEALEMIRDYRWIGGASFGVSSERDPDGGRVTGPDFSVEIPIFDQKQAEIARMESLLEQSKSRFHSLQTLIRNEVQSAVHRIRAARELCEYYRDEYLPAKEQVVKFTQQEQNYMLVDAFELLFVRQQEIQAYRNYIDSLTEYWVARSDLAKVIGLGLPESSSSSKNIERHKHDSEVTDSHIKEMNSNSDHNNTHH
jgi:outer membrane protein, heavy metal efflux system